MAINYLGVEFIDPETYRATAYCKHCKEVKDLGTSKNKMTLATKVARFKGCTIRSLIIGPKAQRGRKNCFDVREFPVKKKIKVQRRSTKPAPPLRIIRVKPKPKQERIYNVGDL